MDKSNSSHDPESPTTEFKFNFGPVNSGRNLVDHFKSGNSSSQDKKQHMKVRENEQIILNLSKGDD